MESEYFQLFLILYDSKLDLFNFCSVGTDKTRHMEVSTWALGTADGRRFVNQAIIQWLDQLKEHFVVLGKNFNQERKILIDGFFKAWTI